MKRGGERHREAGGSGLLTGKRFRKSFIRSVGIEDTRSKCSLFIHHARITKFSDQSFFTLCSNGFVNIPPPSIPMAKREGDDVEGTYLNSSKGSYVDLLGRTDIPSLTQFRFRPFI